jgi:hypothetical protein
LTTTVYSFGYFAIGGDSKAIEQGYFTGKIVNFFRHEKFPDEASFTLPYAVLGVASLMIA